MTFIFSKKLKNSINLIKSIINPSDQDIAYKNWLKDDGDNVLRFDYQLNASSTVFDIGSYRGDFASEVFARYQSKVLLFEPVEKHYTYSKKRFANNSNIEIFNFGLGNSNMTLQVEDTELSTQMIQSKKANIVDVKIRDIQDVLKELNTNHIDLMKINIEGGEYELLTRLYQIGFLGRIKHLQIQFHNFAPCAVTQRNNTIDFLNKTHECDWSYSFVWESWSLRNEK